MVTTSTFSLVNAGIAMLHLARHSWSKDGFTCSMELTLSTIIWMVSLSIPRVALKADSGRLKNADEMVTVPGSEVGKLAMN